jgi:hypothetical protein
VKHGTTCPRFCSQCAGADVRRVSHAQGVITVDGVPARPIDIEAQSASRYYGKRGGKALRGSKTR